MGPLIKIFHLVQTISFQLHSTQDYSKPSPLQQPKVLFNDPSFLLSFTDAKILQQALKITLLFQIETFNNVYEILAACESGVAKKPISDWAAYETKLDNL